MVTGILDMAATLHACHNETFCLFGAQQTNVHFRICIYTSFSKLNRNFTKQRAISTNARKYVYGMIQNIYIYAFTLNM